MKESTYQRATEVRQHIERLEIVSRLIADGYDEITISGKGGKLNIKKGNGLSDAFDKDLNEALALAADNFHDQVNALFGASQNKVRNEFADLKDND